MIFDEKYSKCAKINAINQIKIMIDSILDNMYNTPYIELDGIKKDWFDNVYKLTNCLS